MRLPARRERCRSTVLGEPFLRAVSTGAQPETSESGPPQPTEASEPESLAPFRAMLNLFNACQQADAEIAEIEETLAVDPDALLPEAVVAPARKLLVQTQSDLERLPPGKANEHVIRTAQREGLAVSGRVLEADVRARQRFTTGAISDAADRLAERVAKDPAAIKPSLEMLNDLVETANLDPSDKRLIKTSLEARVRNAAVPSDESPDVSTTPVTMSVSDGQASSAAAGTAMISLQEGESDAPAAASGTDDLVQVVRDGKSDQLVPTPNTLAIVAAKIRDVHAFLNKDLGNGKSLLDAVQLMGQISDSWIRRLLPEDVVATRDEINAASERGQREVQAWLNRQIDELGRQHGYSAEDIANLKDVAGAMVAIGGAAAGRGKGGGDGRGGDRDGRDDQSEQPDQDRDGDRDDDQSQDDGNRSDEDDAFDRIDVSKIKVPKIVKAREPLTSEHLEGIIERNERVDPHRLRTLQATAKRVFTKDANGQAKNLVHTVREFFTKKDLAASLPEIRIFVDGEGKVWTLDHRRVVAARVATQIAERHGVDKIFKLRFKVVSMADPKVREEIIKKLDGGALDRTIIRNADGLSIEIRRIPQR